MRKSVTLPTAALGDSSMVDAGGNDILHCRFHHRCPDYCS
jgi:hypothetical protein